MTDAPTTPNEPPPGSRVRHRIGISEALRDLWRAREVIISIAERDIRSRYKQAMLGSAWAVINPIAMMAAFAVFVQRVADIDTHGAPYALFAFLGLLSWTFFSSALNLGGPSLLTNTSLLNKVRCPREVFPLASVFVAAFDWLIAAATFIGLMAVTTTMPKATIFWVVPLLLIQFAFTIAVVLLFAVLIVYFRDLRHVISPILQLGIFATPVAYGTEKFSDHVLPYIGFFNPLAAVIEGYRGAILYGTSPDWALTAPAAVSTTALLLVGYYLFKRLEFGIADLA